MYGYLKLIPGISYFPVWSRTSDVVHGNHFRGAAISYYIEEALHTYRDTKALLDISYTCI